MTWLMTVSGACIDLACIGLSKVDIKDIAYALSHINRFTGHSYRPISVAEHSLVVCDILERHFQVTSPTGLLAALMHDAHEYLTGDISQPMKQLLGDPFKAEEDRIQRAVLSRFGLLTAFNTHKRWIKDADLLALSSERTQQMADNGDVWPCQVTHPPLDWVRYGPPGSFTPDDWRIAFLNRFTELQERVRAANEAIPTHQPRDAAAA